MKFSIYLNRSVFVTNLDRVVWLAEGLRGVWRGILVYSAGQGLTHSCCYFMAPYLNSFMFKYLLAYPQIQEIISDGNGDGDFFSKFPVILQVFPNFTVVLQNHLSGAHQRVLY